jgi:AcrR family transcriptional regulator
MLPDRGEDQEASMARTPRRPATPKPQATSEREQVIEAFLALLAEKPMEEIGFGEIAARANVPLAQLRIVFGSKLAILAAHIKEIDRQVLGSIGADMAEEPPRERLFDVLMRRLELLAPHKAAVRSLRRSAQRNPGLALALNSMAVRSQQWMLSAADIPASGPKGALRAQGLAALYASVLRAWLDDEDEGLARTMAALDRALGRGQRLAGLLDDLFGIPARLCRLRPRRTRDTDDGTVAV